MEINYLRFYMQIYRNHIRTKMNSSYIYGSNGIMISALSVKDQYLEIVQDNAHHPKDNVMFKNDLINIGVPMDRNSFKNFTVASTKTDVLRKNRYQDLQTKNVIINQEQVSNFTIGLSNSADNQILNKYADLITNIDLPQNVIDNYIKIHPNFSTKFEKINQEIKYLKTMIAQNKNIETLLNKSMYENYFRRLINNKELETRKKTSIDQINTSIAHNLQYLKDKNKPMIVSSISEDDFQILTTSCEINTIIMNAFVLSYNVFCLSKGYDNLMNMVELTFTTTELGDIFKNPKHQIIYNSNRSHFFTAQHLKSDIIKIIDPLFDTKKIKIDDINQVLSENNQKALKILYPKLQHITLTYLPFTVSQKDNISCGLYSIFYAIALLFGIQVEQIKFDIEKMRQQLLGILSGNLTMNAELFDVYDRVQEKSDFIMLDIV